MAPQETARVAKGGMPTASIVRREYPGDWDSRLMRKVAGAGDRAKMGGVKAGESKGVRRPGPRAGFGGESLW